MLWVDCAGPPGSGKSTICDPIFGPHEIALKDIPPPAKWHMFTNEVTRLLSMVREHRSFVPAVRMCRRSFRKMATVDSLQDFDRVYCQTGFVQRGLGLGWRLNDMGISMNELRPFFRQMPLSVGVAMIECDPEVVKQRNKDRENVPETAHENRAFMVDTWPLPSISQGRR